MRACSTSMALALALARTLALPPVAAVGHGVTCGHQWGLLVATLSLRVRVGLLNHTLGLALVMHELVMQELVMQVMQGSAMKKALVVAAGTSAVAARQPGAASGPVMRQPTTWLHPYRVGC